MIEDGVKISELTEASSVSSNVVVPIVSGDETKKINVVDLIYPVGAIYMSVNAANPSTLFGGTWEQIKGRFLLGSGAPDDNTNNVFGTNLTWNGVDKINESVGTTGGESLHTLNINEMPSHNHPFYYAAENGSEWGISLNWNAKVPGGQSGGGTGQGIAYVGGSQAHNNMPPYFVVYIWKRTA